MSLKSRRNLHRGKAHRGLALVLLIFCFSDLVFVDIFTAQVCLDVSASVETKVPSLIARASQNDLDSMNASGEKDDDNECCVDEDCFCCSSNVIHGVLHELAKFNEPRQPADSNLSSLPLSLPEDPFHPPRL